MNDSQPPTDLASSAVDLPTIAKRINAEHIHAIKYAVRAVEHARECGRLLIEVKDQLPHGKFLPWVADNCDVKQRQAQNYMKLDRNWTAIEANTHPDADLTIKGALELLDGPRHEPPQAGPLEVYQDAGLLNDGHLYQLDRFHTVLGDLEYHAADAEPIADWEPESVIVQYLAAMRTEDAPLTFFTGLGGKLDIVRRACIAHDQVLADGGYHINAGDRAAFWWGTFAAYADASVEQLTDAITRWKDRFYSAFGYLLLLHEKCPTEDYKSDYHTLLRDEWWGHHSDIRHAGASAWLTPASLAEDLVMIAFRTIVNGGALPSIMQPWSNQYSHYQAMREREEKRKSRYTADY